MQKFSVVTDQLILQNLYGIPMLSVGEPYDFLLTKVDDKLQLIAKQFKPFFISFDSEKLRYRRAQLSLKKELIAKACQLKVGNSTRILDATAGLGRDAFVLACLGSKVTLLERHPIIAALLEDALSRASKDLSLSEVVSRMTLLKTDALQYCLTQSGMFDVVYLDPMFPEKKKSSLAKKEMQIFQMLAEDNDADLLFEAVKSCAISRLVVKRPLTAAPLAGKKPDIVYKGKTNRFDVYLNHV